MTANQDQGIIEDMPTQAVEKESTHFSTVLSDRIAASKDNNSPLPSTNDMGKSKESSRTNVPYYLTVLISSGIVEYVQKSHQEQALAILNDLGIPIVTVNGNNDLQLEEREKLFNISNIRGNYPQIFALVGETHRFLGGYDWLQENIEKLRAIVRTLSGLHLDSALGGIHSLHNR